MIQISKSVMAALERAAVRRCEERLVEHFRTHAAQQCGTLSTPQLHAVVVNGMERALQHGLRSERDICSFITLMLFFGSAFERDPAYPWIAEILAAPDPHHRLAALENRALDFFEQLLAPDPGEALRRVAMTIALAVPRDMIMVRANIFPTDVDACLRALFTAKYVLVEPRAMSEFIRFGTRSAAQHQITGYDDVIDYLGLQFLLGFDFLIDPLFPWATQIAADPSVPPSERMRRICCEAALHFERLAQ